MKKLVLGLGVLTSSLFGCYSNYDCNYGESCVKAPYETDGVCMKKVDEFGMETYDSSDDDSYDNENNRCDFDMDCPIGFECDEHYKVCVKRR